MSFGIETISLNPIITSLLVPTKAESSDRPVQERRAQLLGVREPLVDDPVQGCFARGNAALVLGDYETAIDYYSVVINFVANDSLSHLRRALAYLQLGDVNEAVADFQQVVRHSPDADQRARAELALQELARSL